MKRAAFVLALILTVSACTTDEGSLDQTVVTVDNQAEIYQSIRTGNELTGEELELLQAYLKRQQLPEGTYLPAGKTVAQMIQEQRGFEEGLAAGGGESPSEPGVEPSAEPTPPGGQQLVQTQPARPPARPAGTRTPPPSGAPPADADLSRSPSLLEPTPEPAPEPPAVEPDRPVERAVEPEQKVEPATAVVPSGHTMRVRLEESLSSRTSSAGDRFDASLDKDLVIDGHLLAPKGSRVVGRVTDAKSSGRVKGRASLAITLERIVVEGESYALNTGVMGFEADPTKKEDAKKVGIGAGAGAIIGAIAGGKKGAAVGGAIGAGAGTGAVLVTRGQEVEFGVEQAFEFELRRGVEMKIIGR